MRYIGVKDFRENLRENLKDLPVALTKLDFTVAIVVSPAFFDNLIANYAIDAGEPRVEGEQKELEEDGGGGGDPEKGETPSENGERPEPESRPQGDVQA